MVVLTDKSFFAKGKRGIVSTAIYGGKKVLVKEKNPDAAVNTISYEALMLQLVNRKGIGPLFIALNKEELIMEFIEGVEIMQWIVHADTKHIKQVLLSVLEQCRTLDLLGINKLEMTHPHKHILIRRNEAIFIDFERARQTEKPKNLTQVCQWITGKDMASLLDARGITIPRDTMLAHAKQYKSNYDVQSYERMREVIRNA